jgi:hypothetical protein
VKRLLDRRRAEGESDNDVLERVLEESTQGDFNGGSGRWSDEEADRVREQREAAKAERKARMRRRVSEDEDADA